MLKHKKVRENNAMPSGGIRAVGSTLHIRSKEKKKGQRCDKREKNKYKENHDLSTILIGDGGRK